MYCNLRIASEIEVMRLAGKLEEIENHRLVELLVADDGANLTRYQFGLDLIGRWAHDICHPAQ
jgi:hypothetical protein